MEEIGDPPVVVSFLSSKVFKQWFSAFVVAFGGVGFGLSLAWTATALPSIQETHQLGSTVLSQTEKSLIGSSLFCGALVSSPVAGLAMNVVGRKATLLKLCLLCLPGWLLLWAGSQPQHLYVGRVLIGIYAGGCTIVIPVFVKELSSPENRGILGSLFSIMLCIGKLISNVIGILCSASTASLICVLHPIVYAVLLLFVHESPSFHLKAKTPKTTNDLADSDTIGQNGDHHTNKFSKACFPIFTVCTLILLAQLCGINVVTFFTNEMFSNTDASIISPSLALVLLATLQVIGGLPTSIFVDKFGRKVLLLSSLVAMTISISLLAAYYYHFNRYFQEGIIVPLVCLTIYCLAYSWGIGNIVWIILAEIIPTQIIAQTSSLANMLYWASAFVITHTYQLYTDEIPLHFWLFAFAVVCVGGVVFVAVCLPETKGLSSEEIQRLYSKKLFPR